MNIISTMFFVFVLAALAIGAAIDPSEITHTDEVLDNAIVSIDNISMGSPNVNESSIPNIEGFFNVLEKFISYAGTFAVETLRAGVHFGNENPGYFEPEFLVNVIRLLIILSIVALLIKPAGYLIVFMIMGIVYLVDRWRARNKKIDREEQNERY